MGEALSKNAKTILSPKIQCSFSPRVNGQAKKTLDRCQEAGFGLKWSGLADSMTPKCKTRQDLVDNKGKQATCNGATGQPGSGQRRSNWKKPRSWDPIGIAALRYRYIDIDTHTPPADADTDAADTDTSTPASDAVCAQLIIVWFLFVYLPGFMNRDFSVEIIYCRQCVCVCVCLCIWLCVSVCEYLRVTEYLWWHN